jgi:shikimate dehydrogenase
LGRTISPLAIMPEPALNTSPFPFALQDRKFLTGLIGRDILASRSPWLHECEADAQGVRLVYSLHDFAALGLDEGDLLRILAAAEAMGFAGVNVTHPYKQAVIAHLDDMSPAAAKIGAVNTVAFAGGKRVGHNTDVSGFAESFRSGLPGVATGLVVQIGAGGAGSATAHALLESGVVSLALFDQDIVKRGALADKLRHDFGADRISEPADLAHTLAGADGIVNATPMGMARYPGSPVPKAMIEPRHWVADIVYVPLETELLHDARMMGCRTLDGSGMAVYQAAAAFDIFTGLSANRMRMRESFVNFVAGSTVKAA